MDALADLPVALDLPAPVADEVAAYVETELGWQVVELAGPPAPALLLTTAPVPGRAFVLLTEGPPASEVVRTGLLAGALDVVAWPDQRRRLADVPARLPASAGVAAASTSAVLVRSIAGVAGGVGTSTVALALAALAAWSGRRTLVVGGDDLLRLCGLPPWRGPGAPEVARVAPDDAAAEIARLARPVPGVDGLVVLGGGRAAPADAAAWPADAVILDVGAGGGDLLVARPDAGLRAIVDAASDEPVLLVGEGPVPTATARRALGRRLVGRVPWSSRVARAGLMGTVPGALPGSWLQALRAIACSR